MVSERCLRARGPSVCESRTRNLKKTSKQKKRGTEEKLKSEASQLLSSCGGDKKVSGVEHEG